MASWPQPPSDALCLWQSSMACLTPKCLTLHTMPRLVSRRSPSLKIDRPQQRKPQLWSTRGPLCSTDTLQVYLLTLFKGPKPCHVREIKTRQTAGRGRLPIAVASPRPFSSSSSPTLRTQRVALQTALHPNLTPANLPPRQSSVWAQRPAGLDGRLSRSHLAPCLSSLSNRLLPLPMCRLFHHATGARTAAWCEQSHVCLPP